MSDALAAAATEVRAPARVGLANAPVSYGAFEITVGSNPFVPPADQLLAAVSAAGYAGIDLGPPGYLGGPDVLAERLRERGLQLAGAYLQLPFSEPAALEREWPELLQLLETLDSLDPQAFAPRPTLADAGSPERRLARWRGDERPRARPRRARFPAARGRPRPRRRPLP